MEERSLQERIELVINTLQDLNIRSTYDNMRKLMGCISELSGIQQALELQEQQKTEPELEPEDAPEEE